MSQAIDTPAGGGSSGGGSSKRAPRGAACLNCRRRKMRCDGIRPICGQCIRTNREIDCEYTDGPGPSPTQVLEEQIARLESRIRELEHPELVAPSVTLNPATGSGLRTQSPAGTIGSAGRSLLGRVVTPDAVPAAIPAGAAPILSHDPSVEPPQDLVRNLVNSFLSHSASLNFFLHVPRFMQAVQQPNVETRRAQLSPALLNAVYLWGAHVSTSNALRAFEPIFQARVTSALSSALRESQYSVINLIQAEVLMANYFFTMSRFLEGRYHCSAAVALALSCRLHKMRSSTDQGLGRAGARHDEQVREYNLPLPRDAVEEGERMRSFWYVYAMDKSWAVAMGSPSHFNGVAQSGLDTPWPLEMAQYEAGGYPPDYRSALTVYNFVSGGPAPPVVARDSQLASRAKASILFERATALASEWSSTETNRNEFYGRFVGLDSLIDRFIATLPPVDRSGSPDIALTSLVTHTLARAATIQLRSSFKDYDRMNDGKDLVAAQAAALALENVFPNMTSRHVDPILAILWTAVCRVLIGEIVRTAAAPQAPSLPNRPTYAAVVAFTTGQSSGAQMAPPTHQQQQQRQQHRAMLDRVMAAMNRFRETSPLMGMLHDGFVSVQGAM
ncbi:hypothetical protein BC628DRAFT_1414358 [Trametes gibbosa]|nr:hypothetical protein BC628DRAFT_1414358 [Trametes gibbosa]UVI59138.1 Zn(2)-Cys(6)39 [Trametes gibbosa]